MTTKVLMKCAKKGINLSPSAFNKVMEVDDPIDFISSVIVKLKSGNYTPNDLISVSGDVIDEIKKELNIDDSSEKPQEKPLSPIKKTDEKKKTTISTVKTNETLKDTKKKDKPKKMVNSLINKVSETVEDSNIKFERNLNKTNVEYDFEIIQDTSKKSYTSGEVENLITYFQSR